MKGIAALALVTVAAASISGQARAEGDDFSSCVARLWPQARAKGVSQAVFDPAFQGVIMDPEVLAVARKQPEFVKPIWEYLDSAVSESRIATGRAKAAEWARTLEAIERSYGVDRHVVLAVWGMESSYGAILDNPKVVKPVIRSLATLACGDPDRAGFGQQQLAAALQILQQGDVTLERMTGSWAGAMGHTQFIPTTYLAHAADFDRDGKRDIWGTIPDALASTANYLRHSGWRADETTVRPVSEWVRLGIRRAGGRAFARLDERASLMLPAGAKGPAFLILPNFRAILHYNNAQSYALAVGHLADRIRGGAAFVHAWPRSDRPLAMEERIEVQNLLAQRGYESASRDGRLGLKSRAAIRAFQRNVGMPADGYASAPL